MAGVKKNRCTFKECGLSAQRIVGECTFCQGVFCSKHRLLEDHKCDGLEDVGTPSLSSSASSTSTTTSQGPQWWLAGLYEVLASDGVGMDMDTADVAPRSARSRATSATPRSSKASAPRSSRVFDENYDDDDEAPSADVPMAGA
ncbi:AN1-type zinc finger domain-containing protein [Candidatus Bathyarchaeota archaeon]|nr:AN1-type zinc finger domain-containing protein [Candidatus Bathyarchaeota archaeon]